MRNLKEATGALLLAQALFGMAALCSAQTPAAPLPEPPPAPAAVAPAPAKAKSWTDYVTIKGDIRVRAEAINDDSKMNSSGGHYTRDRLRLRARIGAEARLDGLKAGLRISTGGADPVSGNVTLGDGDQKKEIRLDAACLDYSFVNDDSYGLNAIGGKMNNPLITYGSDDLVWDSDFTPEGLAAKARAGNDWLTFLGNAEYLFIKDRDANPNLWGWVGQGAVQFAFVPEVSLTVGGSYSGYQNFQGCDVLDWENKNNSYGNSTVKGSVSGSTTNKAWASDFTPVMGFCNLDLWVWGVPVTLYGQALTNPKADANKNGFMGGIALGKAKNPKTFECGYSYARLEKDATPGMWTDSDRWGGGTDGKGSRCYGKYQINKWMQCAVTFFLDKKFISDPARETGYNRLQVDLQAAF